MKLKPRKDNFYAFNINSTNSNKNKTPKDFTFKALTGNFYEDLINSDISIKRNKRKLSYIKNNAIKESIYCNKDIPKSWKTILGYNNEVYKAIDQDPNFAYYLGSSNNKENIENKFFGTKLKNIKPSSPSEKNKKFISLENIDKYIKDNDIDIDNDKNNNVEEIKENNKVKEKNDDIKKFSKTISYDDNKEMKISHHHQWETNNKMILNDKFFSSKLDEYRTKYDIDKFMGNVKHRIKEIQIDEDDIYLPQMIQQRKKNHYREFLREKTQNNRENVLKKTIYSNLIPEKEKDKEIYFNKTFGANKRMAPLKIRKKIKFGPFKTTPVFFNKETNIKEDSVRNKIKRDLELINYFGPNNSNCTVCKRRNMDFYTNSEPNQILILLNYLKKVKLNENQLKIKRKKND